MFTLIGGGPAIPKLKELCTAMNLDDQVLFTGRLPDDQVCRYLSTADVCVDPDPWSEWANRSTMNKVLEYMAFGKPIVAFDLLETRNTAMRAALYAKPNDINLFSEKVNFLLNNPALRKEMGDFGRRRIISELSWEFSTPRLLAAYRRAFNQQEREPATVAPEETLFTQQMDMKLKQITMQI